MHGRDEQSFDDAPLDALRRGPVWLVDAVRGHRERVAEHGAITAGVNGGLLVLYDERSLDAVVPIGDVVAYETLAAGAAARLHGVATGVDELDPAGEVTLVYAFTGVWD